MKNDNTDMYTHLYDRNGNGRLDGYDFWMAQSEAEFCKNVDSATAWKFNFGVLIAVILFFRLVVFLGYA